MAEYYLNITKKLYSIVSGLPRRDYQTPLGELPSNGIYLFYENGETTDLIGSAVDRIVRVGTHRMDGRFPKRIRQHYGGVNSFSGNKNGSVFRKHVGGALMRRANPNDPRLKYWLTQDGPSFADIEEQVSRELRANFSFSCFCVDSAEERLSLESGLIALLSQRPLGNPSASWLGRSAADEKIVNSGIWNTQHVDSEPLSVVQLQRVEALIMKTVEEG